METPATIRAMPLARCDQAMGRAMLLLAPFAGFAGGGGAGAGGAGDAVDAAGANGA